MKSILYFHPHFLSVNFLDFDFQQIQKFKKFMYRGIINKSTNPWN